MPGPTISDTFTRGDSVLAGSVTEVGEYPWFTFDESTGNVVGSNPNVFGVVSGHAKMTAESGQTTDQFIDTVEVGIQTVEFDWTISAGSRNALVFIGYKWSGLYTPTGGGSPGSKGYFVQLVSASAFYGSFSIGCSEGGGHGSGGGLIRAPSYPGSSWSFPLTVHVKVVLDPTAKTVALTLTGLTLANGSDVAYPANTVTITDSLMDESLLGGALGWRTSSTDTDAYIDNFYATNSGVPPLPLPLVGCDPTRDDYWSVTNDTGNPVSLSTPCWDIETIGEARYGAVPLRGGNVVEPLLPGDVWAKKTPAPRILTLRMWVLPKGCDDEVPDDPKAQFNENWQVLKRLFWRTDREIELTRRIRYPSGLEVTTGKGEFVGGLEPTMQGPHAARFTVDLQMADPFFYGEEETETVTDPGGDITNNGDGEIWKMVLTFSGGGPYVLTNETTGDVLTVAEVGTVVVDTENFTATEGGASRLGSISTSNSTDIRPLWMRLVPGLNELTLSDGSCEFVFRTPYL